MFACFICKIFFSTSDNFHIVNLAQLCKLAYSVYFNYQRYGNNIPESDLKVRNHLLATHFRRLNNNL